MLQADCNTPNWVRRGRAPFDNGRNRSQRRLRQWRQQQRQRQHRPTTTTTALTTAAITPDTPAALRSDRVRIAATATPSAVRLLRSQQRGGGDRRRSLLRTRLGHCSREAVVGAVERPARNEAVFGKRKEKLRSVSGSAMRMLTQSRLVAEFAVQTNQHLLGRRRTDSRVIATRLRDSADMGACGGRREAWAQWLGGVLQCASQTNVLTGWPSAQETVTEKSNSARNDNRAIPEAVAGAGTVLGLVNPHFPDSVE